MTSDETAERFSWAPGPDTPRTELSLDADGLALEGEWRLGWDQVTGLSYRADRWSEAFEIAAGGARHRLDFAGEGGEATAPAVMHAIVSRLAARRPGLQVEIHRGGTRWVGFGLGLVCIFGGLALWGMAALGGNMISGGIVFMVMILIGVALTSSNRPGRPGRPMPAETFCAFVSGRAPAAQGTRS